MIIGWTLDDWSAFAEYAVVAMPIVVRAAAATPIRRSTRLASAMPSPLFRLVVATS
jgi:hypothetical protein